MQYVIHYCKFEGCTDSVMNGAKYCTKHRIEIELQRKVQLAIGGKERWQEIKKAHRLAREEKRWLERINEKRKRVEEEYRERQEKDKRKQQEEKRQCEQINSKITDRKLAIGMSNFLCKEIYRLQEKKRILFEQGISVCSIDIEIDLLKERLRFI